MKMGKFKITKSEIEGVFTVEPTVFGDERGYFMETYNENDFKEEGIDLTFVQDNFLMWLLTLERNQTLTESG